LKTRNLRILPAFLIPILIVVIYESTIRSQEPVRITEFKSNLLVLSTSEGNVIASVGPDGALLVGGLSTANTAPISRILESRTQSPVRYVVIGPQDSAHSEGDAGWGRRGAFVAMHESALQRIGGNRMDGMDARDAPPLSPRFVKLGVDRPRIAFSEVLAFDLNGEAIHVVHQAPGYSNSDAIVHYHAASLVYLGEVFPGDGYPMIDFSQGGTLDGLLKTLGAWTGSTIRVVPARGKVTDGAGVEAFRDMIVTVRDRIQHLIDQGRTEGEVVASHPTADLDAKWSHGRVQPDAFVREIYTALKEQPQKSK
jgi:cyclase